MQLQATAMNNAKNVVLVTVFKTACHVGASGHLDYIREAVWRPFMVFIIYYIYIFLYV